jgi:tetratricopeptide (TPR) repeat protein
MRINILSDKNHPDIAICFGDIGNIYENMCQIDLAIDYYHRQLDMEEKCLSFDHALLVLHFDLLLKTLTKNNQLDKAIELCRMKFKFLKNLLGDEYKNHSCFAHTLISFANLLENTDRDEAEKSYKQALSILEHQPDKQSIGKCLTKIIHFYYT